MQEFTVKREFNTTFLQYPTRTLLKISYALPQNLSSDTLVVSATNSPLM